MKTSGLLMIGVVVVLAFACSPYVSQLAIRQCAEPQAARAPHDSVQMILNEMVGHGVPGVALAVSMRGNEWTTAAGLAKIETNAPMETCHLQYLQSISKTYLAVGVLKLYEEGKIDLDSPLTRYLPQSYSRYIDKADAITIRMLLNHTSGIPEYNAAPRYVATLLQHPERDFTPGQYLQYIDGKKLTCAPGSKYSYRNTNYVILALIVDAITGDHARYLQTTIIDGLDLTGTFYRNSAGYLNYPQLVNTYWDRSSDGRLENISLLQRNNVRALVGDDGVVATPADALTFLKALMQGRLLKPETLTLMKSWVNDSKGNPTYGLGLDHATFAGHEAYGHSGGGLGAGCQLYYFPHNDSYVFVAANIGTVTDSPLHKGVGEGLDKLYRVLLK